MKFIDLEANMKQLIWPVLTKFLERFQTWQPKKVLSNIPYDNTLENRSISSNESLVTCSENFRNTVDKELCRGSYNLCSEFQTYSPKEIITSDELVSIISTTNDTNSYKDIDFSCISSLEFLSSEIGPSKYISKEGPEGSALLFNDEIAGLIEDMIQVLEDPCRPLEHLPDIKTLEGKSDYHEATKALKINQPRKIKHTMPNITL